MTGKQHGEKKNSGESVRKVGERRKKVISSLQKTRWSAAERGKMEAKEKKGRGVFPQIDYKQGKRGKNKRDPCGTIGEILSADHTGDKSQKCGRKGRNVRCNNV